MVQHLHLFRVVLDYRMVPLFRMLRVVHFRQQVLKDRLHRRDPLPRLRREVLGRLTVPLFRWDLRFLMGQQHRMLRVIHSALLFLLDPMFRLLRRVPLLRSDLLLLMVPHLR